MPNIFFCCLITISNDSIIFFLLTTSCQKKIETNFTSGENKTRVQILPFKEQDKNEFYKTKNMASYEKYMKICVKIAR